MKSALLIPVAILIAAAPPALACQTSPPAVRAERAMPRVVFTAVVSSTARTRMANGAETIAVTFDHDRTLSGSPPKRTSLDGVLTPERPFATCGPTRPRPHELAELEEGTTVVISGVQSPDAGLIIQEVVPVGSWRGQELLAFLARP